MASFVPCAVAVQPTEDVLPTTTRDPTAAVLHRLAREHLETFLADHAGVLDPKRGYLRPEVRKTFENFLACRVLAEGFARFVCEDCQKNHLVPLSCRVRGLCSSCGAKALSIWADSLDTEVLPRVPYRQWVVTVPKRIRQFFRFNPDLNRRLSNILFRVVTDFVRTITGRTELIPAMIVSDQSFGTLLDFLPHQHALVSDGGFTPDGAFVPISRIRERERRQLEELLRRRILRWLVRIEKLSADAAKRMLAWDHSGFSLHLKRRVRADRREELLRLCTYMRRHPFSPKGIKYNEETGTVLYRAHRMHRGKKRNFASFSATEFLATLSDHIPHRKKHVVRYYGAATPRVRARLFGGAKPPGVSVPREDPAHEASKGRRSWARWIWRVFEVDPLACSCGGELKLVCILLEKKVVSHILEHVGLPSEAPVTQPARAPPSLAVAADPGEAPGRLLPLPDIAADAASARDAIDEIPPDDFSDYLPSDDDLFIDPP